MEPLSSSSRVVGPTSDHSPKLVVLPDLTAASVAQWVAATSPDVLPRVLAVRQVNRKRVLQALRSGTDRDAGFEAYGDFPINDASKASRAKAGIGPEDLTFANLIDFGEVAPVLVSGGQQFDPLGSRTPPPPASEFLDQMAVEFPGDNALLIFDPGKLNQQAMVEFWFKGDPRQALIAALVSRQSPTIPPPPDDPSLSAEIKELLSGRDFFDG